MTPDEAVAHPWIREGLAHKSQRGASRMHHQRRQPPAESDDKPDPYKTAAQPPIKGKISWLSRSTYYQQ